MPFVQTGIPLPQATANLNTMGVINAQVILNRSNKEKMNWKLEISSY
jgi:hypothetical protein